MRSLFFILLFCCGLFYINCVDIFGLIPPARALACNRNLTNTACVNAYNAYQNPNLFIDYQYYQNQKPTDIELSDWLPENICGVGHNNSTTWGGDKRGISIVEDWHPHPIRIYFDDYYYTEYSFCQRRPQDTSDYRFFVSNSTYNPATTVLSWSYLEEVNIKEGPVEKAYNNCPDVRYTEMQFKLNLTPIDFMNRVLVIVNGVFGYNNAWTTVNCHDFVHVSS